MNKIVASSMAFFLISNLGATTAFGATPDSKSSSEALSLKPKPLSADAMKGIEYLVRQQNSDGSWSQGEESKYMASVNQHNGDIHNVADTCIAALALVHAGNLPDSGKYANNVAKAADYVCNSIKNSDRDSLFITDVRSTRVQMKLGQYVD